MLLRSKITLATVAALALGGAGVASAEPEAAAGPAKRMMVSASGVLAMPQADADDIAGTSLGVGASFVYWVNHNVGVVGSFDYVFANTKDVVPDGTDVYFYSVNIGARVTTRERVGAQPFGELTLGRHTAGYDASGADDAQSDLGIRIGGGVTYRSSAGIAFVGQLSYSTAEIEGADINAFMLDLGVAWDL